MKRLTMILLALALGLALPLVAAPKQITLLHVNDSHSHLDAWGPKDAALNGTVGGLPKLAALVAAEKAADPNALFVHAGDFMNGDLFLNEYLGVPELQILQAIGLDVLALGNRDFQQGADVLTNTLKAASTGTMSVVATNIDPAGHALGAWIATTAVREVHGVKVGFIGLRLPGGALAVTKPAKILPYLPPESWIVEDAIDNMRWDGAEVIVCVAHLGMQKARELAWNVRGINVIVNAHDNVVLEQPEIAPHSIRGNTLIVSAGNFYRYLGRLRLSVDGPTVTLVDYALLEAGPDVAPLAWVQSTVEELKSGIVERYGDVYHQQLGWAPMDISAEQNPDKSRRDTPLGNMLTDSYRAFTGTEIALHPLGFIDDPIPKGPVVGADLFRAMSYGFTPVTDTEGKTIIRPLRLVTFRITGKALLGALETLFAMGDNAFPQVSGMRIVYDSQLDDPPRILSARVASEPLDPVRLYSMTVADYVQKVFTQLKVEMQDVQTLSTLAFDASRTFVQSSGEITPGSSNRIRDAAFEIKRANDPVDRGSSSH